MRASCPHDQFILLFEGELHQTYIVLLLEWPQGQHRRENGRRLHTDENSGVDALRHRNAIGSGDIQFERVLIDLRDERRGGNGERKRFSRLTRTGNGPGPFAHGNQFRLHLQVLHGDTHLFVGGKFGRLACFRLQSRCYLLHLRMFPDRGHGQAGWEQKQPADTLLKGRMQGTLSTAAAIGHTGNLADLVRSSHQASQSRTRDTGVFGDFGLGSASKHLFHRPQIPVKLLSLFLIKGRGIKGRTWNGCRYSIFGRGRLARWFWLKPVREGIGDKRRSIRGEQSQGKFAVKGEPLQID
jgi:hypothetical protein